MPAVTSAGTRRLKRPVRRATAHSRREIQQHHEGDLVQKEIVEDVSTGVPARQHLVDRCGRRKGRQFQLDGGTQLAADLKQVPVDVLKGALQPMKQSTDVIADDEVRDGEVPECGGVAVVAAPQALHLLQTLLDAGFLCGVFLQERRAGRVDIDWRRGSGEGEDHGRADEHGAALARACRRVWTPRVTVFGMF
jgi:hypothetical protein